MFSRNLPIFTYTDLPNQSRKLMDKMLKLSSLLEYIMCVEINRRFGGSFVSTLWIEEYSQGDGIRHCDHRVNRKSYLSLTGWAL
jgi:hypothetical protein